MRISLLISMFAVVVLSGCAGQAPQRPSQRMGEAPQPDSTTLAVMNLNQQLAISADKLLAQYVQSLDEQYALYDAGTWIHVIDRGEEDGLMPKYGEEWTIAMRTYNLEGKLLVDSEKFYVIGKQELPLAIEVNIREFHRGAQVRMIAPWYAAYGLKGTEEVPPYENVIIEIELK